MAETTQPMKSHQATRHPELTGIERSWCLALQLHGYGVEDIEDSLETVRTREEIQQALDQVDPEALPTPTSALDSVPDAQFPYTDITPMRKKAKRRHPSVLAQYALTDVPLNPLWTLDAYPWSAVEEEYLRFTILESQMKGMRGTDLVDSVVRYYMLYSLRHDFADVYARVQKCVLDMATTTMREANSKCPYTISYSDYLRDGLNQNDIVSYTSDKSFTADGLIYQVRNIPAGTVNDDALIAKHLRHLFNEYPASAVVKYALLYIPGMTATELVSVLGGYAVQDAVDSGVLYVPFEAVFVADLGLVQYYSRHDVRGGGVGGVGAGVDAPVPLESVDAPVEPVVDWGSVTLGEFASGRGLSVGEVLVRVLEANADGLGSVSVEAVAGLAGLGVPAATLAGLGIR